MMCPIFYVRFYDGVGVGFGVRNAEACMMECVDGLFCYRFEGAALNFQKEYDSMD